MLRANKQRAQQVALAYGCIMLAALAICLVDSLLLVLVNQEPASSFLTTLLVVRQLLSLVRLGLAVVGFLLLLRWLRRAYYNLHQVPGSHPGYPESWAVWAWFIPVASLVRPLTIMREVWYGTQWAIGREVVPATLLGWWWAAYLSDSLLSVVLVGASAGSASPTAGLTNEISSQMFSLLPAFLVWCAVRRIAEFEQVLAYQASSSAPGETQSPNPAVT